MIAFTTKAGTLGVLRPILKSAQILPLVQLTVEDFYNKEHLSEDLLEEHNWQNQPLIVRSSAQNEDTEASSNAGKFLSVGNICGAQALKSAITQVAAAMGDQPQNQILIQPYLSHVDICGVAFTIDPNTGGNYYILNYDDTTGSTTTVTDGTGENLKTYCYFKAAPKEAPSPLNRIIALCRELEQLFDRPALDLEFAITENILYLLQVRPLVLHCHIADLDIQKRCLKQIYDKICGSMQPHPDLCGSYTIYGVMPDWNPAEMIGIHPKPLALSLYKEIITDGVWAYQRDNYGYRNLRSFPLMLDFCGMPYIDTRVSFNSFLPKGLSEPLAQKLTEYYLNQLRKNPEKHDKIEFEIAYTCYTFDLSQRVEKLREYGFSKEETTELIDVLRQLTNSIISKENGLWKKDAEKISILKSKHQEMMDSNLGIIEKIYWLLEYCKRYGTLPFAGLARAGFIAVEFLSSLVSVGILNEEERVQYMNGLSTVGKQISQDYAWLSKEAFLSKYGHLRPGTYDICSARYDQADNQYFDFENQPDSSKEESAFKLSLDQLSSLQSMLEAHHLQADVLSLFHFIKEAIEGREYAKFVFTHTLSDLLELLAELGKQYGLSREEMSYVTIQRITSAYTSADDIGRILCGSIQEGPMLDKRAALSLPPLIDHPEQVYGFFFNDGEPNYVTQKSCISKTACLPEETRLEGKIVLIRSADPGYDWIFSRNIAGFITAYGGANSHMAIRSAEFGLPAVIGVGENAFNRYSAAKKLKIDCRNKRVEIIS